MTASKPFAEMIKLNDRCKRLGLNFSWRTHGLGGVYDVIITGSGVYDWRADRVSVPEAIEAATAYLDAFEGVEK